MRTTVGLLLLLSCYLAGAQGQTEDQTTDQSRLLDQLQSLRSELTATKTELQAVDARLKFSESQQVQQREKTESPKVAFSAALSGSGRRASYFTEITVIYTNVFTNVGNAYNQATGVFTAPVKGVYHFTFTAYSVGALVSGVHLFKNSARISSAYNVLPLGPHFATNAATLELHPGDRVYMVIPLGSGINDDAFNRSTFSGFLLFTL